MAGGVTVSEAEVKFTADSGEAVAESRAVKEGIRGIADETDILARVLQINKDMMDNLFIGLSQGINQGLKEYQTQVRNAGDDTEKTKTKVENLGLAALTMASTLGNLAAGAIRGAFNAVGGVLDYATDAVASNETMNASFEALLRKELMLQNTTTKSVAVGKTLIKGQEEQVVWNGKQKKSIDDVNWAISGYNLAIANAQSRLEKVNAGTTKRDGTWIGPSELDVANAQRSLDQAKRNLDSYNGEFKVIPASTDHWVTQYKKVTETTITDTQAKELAAKAAKELYAWSEKLAIKSPFDQENIGIAVKTAMAYRFNSKEAKDLTETLVDWAAANGKSAASIAQVSYPLGQINMSTKLYTQDLRQLLNAGIDVVTPLQNMGYTLDDVGKQSIDPKKFLAELFKTMNGDWKGAAANMSNTFSGLISSLSDLKKAVARDFFVPIFDAVRPLFSNLVDSLNGGALRQSIAKIGQDIGGVVRGVVDGIGKFIGKFQTFVGTFQNVVNSGGSPIAALRMALSQIVPPEAMAMFDKFYGVLWDVFGWFQANGPTITQIGGNIAKVITGIAGAGLILRPLVTILGAVIGAVTSPLSLLIAAAGLLLTAWQNNWFGIRDAVANALTFIQPMIDDVVAWFQVNIPLAIQALAPVIADITTWFQVNIPLAMQAAGQFWESTLKPALNDLGVFITTQVVPAVSKIVEWLKVNVPIAAQASSDFFNNTLLPAAQGIGNFFVNTVVPAVKDVAKWLGDNIPVAVRGASDFFNNTLLPAFQGASDFINTYLRPAFESFANFISTGAQFVFDALGAAWTNVINPALTVAWNVLSTLLQPAIEDLQPVIQELDRIGQVFADGVLKSLKDGFQFLKDVLKGVKDLFDALTKGLNEAKLPEWLVRHSPSPIEQTFMGVHKYLKAINKEGMPDFSQMGSPTFDPNSMAAREQSLLSGGAQPQMSFQVTNILDGQVIGAESYKRVGGAFTRDLSRIGLG